jgi:lipopolysaccharide transport system permease protein
LPSPRQDFGRSRSLILDQASRTSSKQDKKYDDVAAAISDISEGMSQARNCAVLATTAINLRYRRSILGPLWVTVTSCIFVFTVSYLYSAITDTHYHEYLVNLAVGWVIWQFIYDSVVDGALTFRRYAEVIQSTNIGKFVFVLKSVISNLLILALNLPVVVLAFAVAGIRFSEATWLVLPGMALIVLSGVWASALFGTFCARYRDLGPMLQAAMRVSFFLTPIIWSPTLLPAESPRRLFVDLNPFAHYVAIWRKPLLGEYPELLSWLVTGGVTAAGLALAFVVFARFRQRLVFWV